MRKSRSISKVIISFFISILGLAIANGYFLWLKSFDNTITNISAIQKEYDMKIPIVWFIFDFWSSDVKYVVDNMDKALWTNKIYHITLSPQQYTAKQVAEWKYDSEYKDFFQTIKDNDLKVIFRTMHEMNWWRYPWGSNPAYFQQAWIHVRELSRQVWLDQNNILFDMSVNHRDMPTNASVPSQSAPLITCDKKNKYKTITYKTFVKTWYRTETVTRKVAIEQTSWQKLTNQPIEYKTVTETRTVAYPVYNTTTKQVQNCYTFEDYYPGDEYVDIMWVTFYNRWKATYSRQRYSPDRIMNDSSRDTLKRLKSYNKPIFIDEVGTTAVWYTWAYSQEKSQESYQNDYYNKNIWLTSLRDFLLANPQIVWALYFNIDYTNWLQNWTAWEADWAVINLNNWKLYEWIFDIYNAQESYDNLFNIFTSKNNPSKNNPANSISIFNTTKFTDQQIIDLADLMISRFGKDWSLVRVKNMNRKADNEDLKALLNVLQYIFENK